jgi:hypothetical protein
MSGGTPAAAAAAAEGRPETPPSATPAASPPAPAEPSDAAASAERDQATHERDRAVAAALSRANVRIRSTHLAELNGSAASGGVDVAASARVAAAAAQETARAPPPAADEAASEEQRREEMRREMERDLVGPTLEEAGLIQRCCYYALGSFWGSLFALAKWLAETRLIPAWVRRNHIDGAGRRPANPVANWFAVPSLTGR